jgi:hypothetical protein
VPRLAVAQYPRHRQLAPASLRQGGCGNGVEHCRRQSSDTQVWGSARADAAFGQPQRDLIERFELIPPTISGGDVLRVDDHIFQQRCELVGGVRRMGGRWGVRTRSNVSTSKQRQSDYLDLFFAHKIFLGPRGSRNSSRCGCSCCCSCAFSLTLRRQLPPGTNPEPQTAIAGLNEPRRESGKSFATLHEPLVPLFFAHGGPEPFSRSRVFAARRWHRAIAPAAPVWQAMPTTGIERY